MTKIMTNRELSWLQFNKRVLHQAVDSETPLLERLSFMSIYGSNMDEFFMVRIGSLSDQMVVYPNKIDEKTGDNAAQQIDKVINWLNSEEKDAAGVIKKLMNRLREVNVHVIDFNNLSKIDSVMTKKYFNNEIKPLLSAQIIDPHHPFPFLNNNESYLMTKIESKDKKIKYGIIPLGRLKSYYSFTINEATHVFFANELIAQYLSTMFKKYEILEIVTIRVTRNADVDVSGEVMDDYEDFADVMEKLLKKRKRLGIVRVQMNNEISDEFKQYLVKELEINEKSIIINHFPLDLSFGHELKKELGQNYPNYLYPPVSPVVPIDFTQKSGLSFLENKDLLLHFPYHSSQPFIQLIHEAANDPDVISIKISLYRLASPSRIAAALAYAAEKGKEVVAVMELRARFDEQSNIDFSKLLEDAGCTVLYGLSDYKVHSKVCLITSLKNGTVSYITYVGTGNFNESTQEQYTDLSYITSNRLVGEDANHLFDALAINETVDEVNALWIAPNHFRLSVADEIEHEIERHQKTGDGEITFKINSMNDILIMNKLIEASQAGVKVQLIIRGICCLIPQIEGYTDNVIIKSIVGRHLEHSRIFRFGPAHRAKIYIGSGDFLNRNTQRRVEAFIEITQSNIKEQINHILDVEIDDSSMGWIMQPDLNYEQLSNKGRVHSQDVFRRYFSKVEEIEVIEEVRQESWFRRLLNFFK